MSAIRGKVVKRGDPEYEKCRYQYASTSMDAEALKPAMIVYPDDDGDIKASLAYARRNNVAVAVSSGGHSYCGASSTGGDNIQINLSGRFAKVRDYTYTRIKFLNDIEVELGAGARLGDIFNACKERMLFFPHGQCVGVCIGGHIQSSGHSVVGRMFGRVADFVVRFSIILADGTTRVVRRECDGDADLWFAFFGGSPGNFGVLTQVVIRCLRDVDHPRSRLLNVILPYNRRKLESILKTQHAVNDDGCAKDMQISITVSRELRKSPIPILDPKTLDDVMSVFYKNTHPHKPMAIIILTVCYGNSGGPSQDDSYVGSIFDRFLGLLNGFERLVNRLMRDRFKTFLGQRVPMSIASGAVMYWNQREYNLSAFKQAYLGNSRTLSAPRAELGGQPLHKWLAGKVDDTHGFPHVLLHRTVRIVFQYICFEDRKEPMILGEKWRVRKLAVERGNTHDLIYDVFYNPRVDLKYARRLAHDMAEKVQSNALGLVENSNECQMTMMGPIALDGRHPILDEVRRFYYADEGVYRKVLGVKRAVDPKHLFSPNTFCVGASRHGGPFYGQRI